MPKIANWVKETVSGTPGTGTITLGGAVTGFCRFQDAFVTTDKVIYIVEDGNNKEEGIGTLTTGSPWTLSRNTVLRTIASGTYDDTSPAALTLTSAAIVGIAATAESAGIIVGFDEITTSSASTCTTVIPVDDTIPQITEGNLLLTLPSYTPKFADSKLIIEASVHIYPYAVLGAIAIFKDSGANAIATASTYSEDGGGIKFIINQLNCRVTEVSGNTTARVYTLRCGPHAAGSVYINGGSGGRRYGGTAITSLRIFEIRQ